MPFKLYVDSRFRQETGGDNSDSDFSIELPQSIQVKGRAFVDTVLIPNTFYVVRAGENDRIHIREGAFHYRVCIITEGQYDAYTLKNAMTTALNTGTTLVANSYIVTHDDPYNKLVISNSDPNTGFTLYPAKVLETNGNMYWNAHITMGAPVTGPMLDLNNLRDSGGVTGFTGSTLQIGNQGAPLTAENVVNCLPYHNLFLRSSLGSGYDAIGPDGSSDIIRRITCQVPLNDMIANQFSLPHDSITVGDMQISSLSFRLTDCFGKTVDTKGHHISFSIIFLEDD